MKSLTGKDTVSMIDAITSDCARNILVCGGQGTTDLRGRSLCLVHRDSSTERTNAKAADETTKRELDPRVEGSDLNEDSDHENHTLRRHCISTTKPVRRPRENTVSPSPPEGTLDS